jgi:voltage-gated potassium channel
VAWAVLALLLVVAVGTLGFWWLEEHWNAWDALFFTLVTITTVGYEDYGLDGYGEIFALFLLLAGIGTYTYAFSQLVQLAMSQRFNWRLRMEKHIASLSDHFIVCGAGRVGQAICERFEASGQPLVVVDTDEQRCEWARQRGHFVIEGDAGLDETLRRANIRNCRGLVACTANENENLVITLTARSHHAECTIIARCDHEDAAAKFRRAGATRVVAPALYSGGQIAKMLVRPHLADFLSRMEVGDGDCQLTEIILDEHHPLVGQTPERVGREEPSLVFVAVKPTDGPLRIRPDSRQPFCVGEVVIVAGTLQALSQIQAPRLAA